MAQPQGLLEVHGTVDLAQFWSTGTSDADTVKVALRASNPVEFAPQRGAQVRVTNVLVGAQVRGDRGKKAAVDNQNRITVRLEGVDAPELHYPVTAEIAKSNQSPQQAVLWKQVSHEYRQHFGEGATTALEAALRNIDAGPLPCVVQTWVDHPNDVFDTYGRFVGWIMVPRSGTTPFNVNRWLVQSGCAYPTFYNSMRPQDIIDLRTVAVAAQKRPAKGVWPRESFDTRAFDFKLLYRRRQTAPGPADVGDVLMPKLYRRSATWHTNRFAKMIASSFRAWLGAKKVQDLCFDTDDFLTQQSAATPRRLIEFISSTGKFNRSPESLVFVERPSTLLDSNGKPVTAWW
jgi:endonuclease YncB( thermonuclease family)